MKALLTGAMSQHIPELEVSKYQHQRREQIGEQVPEAKREKKKKRELMALRFTCIIIKGVVQEGAWELLIRWRAACI